MTLALMGNTLLRTAITRNLVSFPAQIRPFMKRNSGDLQQRIVQLYFVRGWSVRSICDRYGLSKAMAHKLLGEWRVRAVESGYIQEIEPGSLAAFLRESSVQAGEFDTGRPAVPLPEAVPTRAPAAAREMPEFVYERAVPKPIQLQPIQLPIPLVEHRAALSAGSGV